MDNTLFDTEQLSKNAGEQAIEEMIKEGLQCTKEQGINSIKAIITKKDKFERIVKFFGPDKQEIIDIGKKKYYRDAEFVSLTPFQGVLETLTKLKNSNYRLFLLSQGERSQQERKIKALNIENYFEKFFFPHIEKKEESFEEILQIPNLDPKETIIIGDRIDHEIKIGNQAGMKTIRFLFGKYQFLKPHSELDKPDYEITNISEIINIIQEINQKETPKNIFNKNLNIVTIGGGTGTAALLEGLKEFTENITTIVTVTDSGRSTGMIRRELDMPAPGDTRNCLLALANSEQKLYDLFQYRFEQGAFEGYSFGNIFLAALTKLTGSFEKAIEEASRILNLKGRVHPATFDNIHICAELEDGNILEEEDKIIDRHNDYVYLRPKIKRVFHKPEGKVNEKAIQKIEEADLIIISPGSLYTSILSNLVVKGIPEAIKRSKAKKVYVCNIMTQVSQTYNYKASDHIKQILKYMGTNLDFVILNNRNPPEKLLESYKKEKAFLVENDCEEIEKLGVKILLGDFLDDVDEKKLLWEKKDLLRHNPKKISEVLVNLVKNHIN